jgi:hypothetical protein
MALYRVTSPAGARHWTADDADQAREQHADAFPDEPAGAIELAAIDWQALARDLSDALELDPDALATLYPRELTPRERAAALLTPTDIAALLAGAEDNEA